MGQCPVWYDQTGNKVQDQCSGCQYCPDGSLCNECTTFPSDQPTSIPTSQPSAKPTTSQPTVQPTIQPSTPTVQPSNNPSATTSQSNTPTESTTFQPSQQQAIITDTSAPSVQPSKKPVIITVTSATTVQPSQKLATVTDTSSPIEQPSQKPVIDSSSLRANASTSTMATGAVAGIAASLFVVICVCLPVLYLVCCVGGAAAGGKDKEAEEESSKPTYYFDYEGNADMANAAGDENATDKAYNDTATDVDPSEVGAPKGVDNNKRAMRRGSTTTNNNNPLRGSPATESDHSKTGDKNFAPTIENSTFNGVYHNSYFQGSDKDDHTPSDDGNDSELPAAESARSTTGLIA